jgi:hypothetical protein
MTTSNRNATAFKRPGEVRNGHAARAGTLDTIANNHTYLATQDAEMMTAYIGELENDVIYFDVRMPPYAQWVEFFVLCAGDYPVSTTPLAIIFTSQSASGDSALTTQIPAATTNVPEDADYDWVRFTGRVTDDTFTDAPRAVHNNGAETNYSLHEIRLTCSAGAYIRTVQYRALPEPPPYEY